VVHPEWDARLGLTVCEPEFQLVSVHFSGGLTVVGAYLTPKTILAVRKRFQAHLARLSRGKAILAGDFNARHVRWDSRTTPNGVSLVRFAQTHNFKIAAPAEPTFMTGTGAAQSTSSC